LHFPLHFPSHISNFGISEFVDYGIGLGLRENFSEFGVDSLVGFFEAKFCFCVGEVEVDSDFKLSKFFWNNS
jgi:hypothetical protein